MEKSRQRFRLYVVLMMLLTMFFLMISPALACSSSRNGTRSSSGKNGCKDCILDQMKYGCPSCVPILRCMARCLWGGNSRSRCVTRCDCNGGKPTLADCKKCMSRCKCSCLEMA